MKKKKEAASRPSAIHIIRRQAARILKIVLNGNAKRRAQASIKSLVFQPKIISKKATFALICQTLKYLSVIKEVLLATDLLSGKQKIQPELYYVLAHDLFFDQEILPSGDAETLLLSRKNALKAGLVRLLLKKNVSDISELLSEEHKSLESEVPRYIRVNTLKSTVEQVLKTFRSMDVKVDELLPDVLVLPAGLDLHDHPLVQDGSIFLQGKASCLPAHALNPEEHWEVLDACAAPGNKTVHLAALMKGKGKVIACEMNASRFKLLKETIKRASANNVQAIHEDFLKIDAKSPDYSKVEGILLDPSCSGSGTSSRRLDHLLPSQDDDKEAETKRIKGLARFQKAALVHAFSFPKVRRIVYSTCSLNEEENEEVIKEVIEDAKELGFELDTPFPSWPYRGNPVFDGAHHLLRTEPSRDKMDGFFVAVFHKISSSPQKEEEEKEEEKVKEKENKKRKTSPATITHFNKKKNKKKRN